MSDIKLMIKPPSLFHRIYSVWYRHVRVYTNNLFSNGLPPFLEPIIFLLAIGAGLGQYITKMDGIPYLIFLASAIMVSPSMYTASFETTFGTFVRLEFDKVYDGMLASPITHKDLIIGEILFCGTKALFFSFAVLIVLTPFQLISLPMGLLAPFGGFITGLMFAVLSLLITGFVTNINHFNFYFTGLLTPMFFFSGIVFPISNLPETIRFIPNLLPLTHATNIVRALCLNKLQFSLLFDLLYAVIFILIIGYLALKKLRKRLID